VEVTDPSQFGTVTFGEPETVELAVPGEAQGNVTVTCAHGEWRPPERLARFLPEDFSVPLDCYTGSDGLRRIVPRCSFEELIDLGAVGGLAVLHGVRGSNPEVDQSYRAMLLIHQRVRGRSYCGTRGMREHLTREFSYSRDLYICGSGRLSEDERDVLPDDLGLNAAGEGHRLTVSQLTGLGRRAAEDAGHRNPTNEQAIGFGLYEAAKRNPLEVESERVSPLIEMALFDIDHSEDAPSEELIGIVTERLLEAIHRHLEDRQEAFDGWFTGPGNSLVKQISQQANRPGGRLPRGDVRQALLHLGWRAYRHVGQCVHALMRTIKNSIPVSLSDQERRLYGHMHESQPYYGNLPLALLAERSRSLRRAILAIWEEPDEPVHVHVLHRLCWYYADMVRRRREADRRSKQRSASDGPESSADNNEAARALDEDADAASEGSAEEDSTGARQTRPPTSTQLIDNLHVPSPDSENDFAEVADHIRRSRAIECAAGCTNWEYLRAGETADPVAIRLRCECGDVEQTIELPFREFAEKASSVLEREPSLPRDSPASDEPTNRRS
jgi:hypothetical protein